MARKVYYVVIEADPDAGDPDLSEVAQMIDSALGAGEGLNIEDVTVYDSLKNMIIGEMSEEV